MRLFVSVIVTGFLFLLCSVPAFAADKPLKLGFVYVSPADEAGWSHSHDLSRQALARLPGITAVYKDSVPEGYESERAIRDMAQSGCNVIFTTSFGYMDPTLAVAREFPQTIFLHCSGFKTAPNVSTYFARIYQARYLTGLVAGAMTRKNVVGFVAAYPIPEVIRGINAFTLGVRAANPRAEVRVMWTKTWYDLDVEKNTTYSLIDAGADIIAQHQDSPAPQQAAQERGVYSVGYHTDMSPFAPKAHLVAAIWNWLPFYSDVVAKVRAGTWKTSESWPGLESGIVAISKFGPMVPKNVQDAVLARKEDIITGKFTVFTGPVRDQNGKIRIQKDEKADDKTLLDMNWFVEGVTGASL